MYGKEVIFQLTAPAADDLTEVFTAEFGRLGLSLREMRSQVDEETSQMFFRAVTRAPESLNDALLTLGPTVLDRCTKQSVRYAGEEKVVLLATKERHCLDDILWRHAEGKLGAEVLGVVSNYEHLSDLVGRYGIPFHCAPMPKFEGKMPEELRLEHERRITELVRVCSGGWPVWLGMAKYMQVLGGPLLEAFPDRIINIHHGLLPSFKGANPYRQAWEGGAKIIGATGHFAVKDLDEGPFICQDVVSVEDARSWEEMRDRGRNVETRVFARALKLVLEGRVFLATRKRTVVFP